MPCPGSVHVWRGPDRAHCVGLYWSFRYSISKSLGCGFYITVYGEHITVYGEQPSSNDFHQGEAFIALIVVVDSGFPFNIEIGFSLVVSILSPPCLSFQASSLSCRHADIFCALLPTISICADICLPFAQNFDDSIIPITSNPPKKLLQVAHNKLNDLFYLSQTVTKPDATQTQL